MALDGIPFLRFTADAQEVFDAWREVLEVRLRTGEEHPVLESHIAKYRSLLPSLALLIHLANEDIGPVGTKPQAKATTGCLSPPPRTPRIMSTERSLLIFRSYYGQILYGRFHVAIHKAADRLLD